MHFSSASNEHLRKKVKGVGPSSWKSIAHWSLIMIHLIMDLKGIGPGNIWSMSHKFEWGSNEEMLRSWPRKLQDHIPMTFYKHLINVQDLVQGAPGALSIDFQQGFNKDTWRNWPRKYLEKFPFASIRIWERNVEEQVTGAPGVFSIDFNKELAQGLPGACSINLKEDSIMELEGIFSRGSRSIFHRLLIRISLRRLRGLAQGIASA